MMVVMTPEGFSKVYEIFLTTCSTYKEAYEKAEEVHLLFHGCRKFSDIDSFRKYQQRQLKK